MPLFGKHDEAEDRFNEAKRYTDRVRYREDFDLDKAIGLLEEVLMRKPDKKKYREELEVSQTNEGKHSHKFDF